MKKKFLIFILALVMTLIFVPGIASAANTTEFAGGSGTAKDPFLISTKTQLNNVRKYRDAHFKLKCDIVFTDADFAKGGAFYNGGAGWTPIGEDSGFAFTGTFDGNGFAVKNLYVNISSDSSVDGVYSGLFGYNKGIIQNLGIADGKVSATSKGYIAYAGGIAGYNYGTITDCYNTGDVSAITKDDTANAGGITGYNNYDGIINNCYNTGNISAMSESHATAGGIVGDNFSFVTITRCYNTGDVSAIAAGFYAGGIVGRNEDGSAITDCYNTGDVSAIAAGFYAAVGGIAGENYGAIKNCYNIGGVSVTAADSYAGGIAGYNFGVISKCYNTGAVSATSEDSSANAGGITGRNSGFNTNCYYLNTISVGVGLEDYIGLADTTKCTATQMRTKSTYVGFDFAETWNIDANSGYNYPFLNSINPYKTVTANLSTTSYTYNGKVKTPAVTVKNAVGKTLTKNVDYTVTYASGRINAGNYKVTVKGIGKYSFTKTLTFKINPAKASNCAMKLSTYTYTYNGKVKTPTVKITSPTGSTLTKGTSYTVSYESGRVNVGTYTVKVTMKGNYTGTKTQTFKINPIKASNCAMKLSTYTYTYNGKVKAPNVTIVSPTGSTLTKGTSYTVTYSGGRINVGTYTVKVTMKGNYTGTKTQTFKINPAKASNCIMYVTTTNYAYDGKVKTPGVAVISPMRRFLTEGTSYTVTYASGRRNAGTYTVKVTMMGNYTGTRTLSFKIKPVNAANCGMVLSIDNDTYDGRVKNPTLTVTSPQGKTLTEGTSYTVTYASGRKNVGTYTAKVTMKGNYTGTRTLSFKILPPTIGLYDYSVDSKSITVKVEPQKSSQVTGYQIRYYAPWPQHPDDRAIATTKTFSGFKTASYTIKGLRSHTLYYVQFRTYKTVNNINYYSHWTSHMLRTQ